MRTILSQFMNCNKIDYNILIINVKIFAYIFILPTFVG